MRAVERERHNRLPAAGVLVLLAASAALAGEPGVAVDPGQGVVVTTAGVRAGAVDFRDGALRVDGAAVDWDALALVAVRRAAPWPASPDAARLRDGQIWRGHARRAGATRLWFAVDGAGEQAIAVADLADLAFAGTLDPPDADPDVPDNNAPDADTQTPHRLLRRAATPVPGKLLGLDAERVSMRTAAGPVRVPRDTVVWLRLAAPAAPTDEAAAADADGVPWDEAVLADGQVWRGRLAPAADGFVLTRPDGSAWPVAWDAVVRVRRGAHARPAVYADGTRARGELGVDDPALSAPSALAPLSDAERRRLVAGTGHRWETGQSAAMPGEGVWRACVAPVPGQRGTAILRLEEQGRPPVLWRVGENDPPRWVWREVKAPARLSVQFDKFPTFPCGLLVGDAGWYAGRP